MNSYILLKTDTGNFTLDLTGNENISYNYLIADIKDISKKRTSYSKTINVPGTKNNNQTFTNIFEITSDSVFNPNKAVNAQFIVDGLPVITGKLKLNKINYNAINNTFDYDIVIYSGNYDLASLIGNKLLTELDLTSWNHTLTTNNVINSWTGTTPWVYPIVDYNRNYTLSNLNMANPPDDLLEVAFLNPWLKVKPLIYKIFNEAGLNIESNFFEGDLFSSLIVNTSSRLRYTPEQIKNFSVECWNNADLLLQSYATPNVVPVYNTFIFDDITNGYDYGNNYNSVTGEFAWSGQPYVSFNCNLYLSASATTVAPYYYVVLNLLENGNIINKSGQYLINNRNLNVNHTFPYFIINSASTYTVQIKSVHSSLAQTYSADLNLNPNSSITVTVDDNLNINDEVIITNFINDKVKQIEFVSSIFKTFNLFIEQSLNDDSTYIIEPRDEFYSGGRVLDWTSKLDISQPIKQELLSELQSKKFLFTWSKDDDYFNKTYSDSYNGDVYGQHEFEVDNDFLDINSVTKIEPIFTPLIEKTIEGSNTITTPVLFNWESSQVILRQNIPLKLACYKQIDNCDYYIIGSQRELFGVWQRINYYGYAGTLYPSVANPQFSLNFGTPSQTKFLESGFTNTGMFYPEKNIFTEYYSDFIDEITDKNNKLITVKLHLNNSDIANLSFRNAIKLNINGNTSYFKLNSIKNFNPIENGTCTVELIKSENTVPSPRIYRRIVIRQDTGNGSTQVGRINLGNNNQILSPFSVVFGDNNITDGNNTFVFGTKNFGKGNNLFLTGNFNTGQTNTVLIGGTGNTSIGKQNIIIGGYDNILENKFDDSTNNIIIGGDNNIIRFANSNNAIIASSNSEIQTTGITNSVILASRNSIIQGNDNLNSVILGGENITSLSANTVYLQRGVITEFYRAELAVDSARMVTSDKFGYLQPLILSGNNGIAVTNSGGSIIWSYTGATGSSGGTGTNIDLSAGTNITITTGGTSPLIYTINSAQRYISGGTGTGSLISISPAPVATATGNYSIAMGQSNSVVPHNSIVIGGQTNAINGTYSQLSSIVGGSGNIIQTSTIASTNNSILGGYVAVISGNTFRSAIVAGANNLIDASSYAFIGGGINNKVQGLYSGTYSKFSSIIGGNGNTTRGFNNSIIAGTNCLISGTSSNILAGSSNQIINGNTSSIINGKSNYLGGTYGSYQLIGNGSANRLFNSPYSSIINGAQNYIYASNNSGILTGRYNAILSANYSSVISGKNITGTTSSTAFGDKLNLRNLTGTTTRMVVADSGGTLSATTIPANFMNYKQSTLPSNSAKRYYRNSPILGAIANGTFGQHTLVLAPFYIGKDCDIDEMMINVTTTGGTGVFSLAVYDNYSQGGLFPGNLKQSFGSGLTNTTGIKSLTASTPANYTKGMYWLALWNSTSFAITVSSNNSIDIGTTSSNFTNAATFISAATWSNSFPANMTGVTNIGTVFPMINYHMKTIYD